MDLYRILYDPRHFVACCIVRCIPHCALHAMGVLHGACVCMLHAKCDVECCVVRTARCASSPSCCGSRSAMPAESRTCGPVGCTTSPLIPFPSLTHSHYDPFPRGCGIRMALGVLPPRRSGRSACRRSYVRTPDRPRARQTGWRCASRCGTRTCTNGTWHVTVRRDSSASTLHRVPIPARCRRSIKLQRRHTQRQRPSNTRHSAGLRMRHTSTMASKVI